MSRYDDMVQALADVSLDVEDSGPRARKRQRILESASALFQIHGYRKTSVEDVARAAHTAKGTVYLYFDTKADLLMHAIVEEKKKYMVHLRPVLENPDPRERLRLWLVKLIEMVPEMPLTSRLLAGDRDIQLIIEEMDAELVEQSQTAAIAFLARLIADAMEEDLAPEVLDERARLLISIFHSASFFTDETLRFGLPLERLSNLLADMLLPGVLASATAPRELQTLGATP